MLASRTAVRAQTTSQDATAATCAWVPGPAGAGVD